MNKVEFYAQIVHEAIRVFNAMHGDHSIPTWAHSTQHMKDLTVAGVKGALNGQSAKDSHEEWMNNKLKEGWVHGKVKNNAKKTHPALIPYEELSKHERIKDELVVNIVNALKESLDIE